MFEQWCLRDSLWFLRDERRRLPEKAGIMQNRHRILRERLRTLREHARIPWERFEISRERVRILRDRVRIPSARFEIARERGGLLKNGAGLCMRDCGFAGCSRAETPFRHALVGATPLRGAGDGVAKTSAFRNGVAERGKTASVPLSRNDAVEKACPDKTQRRRDRREPRSLNHRIVNASPHRNSSASLCDLCAFAFSSFPSCTWERNCS